MNKKIEEIFINNFQSAQLIAARLKFSRRKLAPVLPISPKNVSQLKDETQETVDAFIKRFEQLEDSIENKLFRGVLLLEQENISGKSKRDLTLLMEKFGILESAEQWSSLSILRNKLVHNYPNDPESQAERINEVFNLAGFLLDVLGKLKRHVTEKKLIHAQL